MFQNLKVDIVYYKTNTDFEMEFNLCGCCRMRLLTDKAPDRKTALHSLARAVSRSRIIIITGGLFGEDGITNLVSGAIGKPLDVIENKAYGITDEQEIQILKGATPLVTADGYFGGCIIESGPQTMILLSESKNIRKAIMQNLIHPYIEELCAIELKEKAAATADSNINPPEPAPQEETDFDNIEPEQNINEAVIEDDAEDLLISEEPEDNADNTEIQNTDDSQDLIIDTDVSTTDGMLFETYGEEDTRNLIEPEHNLFTETKKEDYFPVSRITTDTEENRQFVFGDIDQEEKMHRSSLKINILTLIIVALLLIALAILCYCIFYVPSKNGVNPTEYIRETFGILFNKT